MYVSELFSDFLMKGKQHMGFWDTLGKVVDKSCDFMAEFAKTNARSLDRMSDEEIEKRHFKSAQMIRRDAATMSDGELKWKYSRPADEVKRDVNEMSDENLETKYSKSADEVRMEADMLRFRAEMYQMEKQKRNKRNEDEAFDFEGYDDSECYDDFD